MLSMLAKKQPAVQMTARPPAAVELSPEGVIAAALPGKGASALVAFEPLLPGAITPGIGGQNIVAPDVVAAAIRKALDQTSPRKRAVTLVVPDLAVRVFVLDFDSLPSKPLEAIPVLRFRLRKLVPFDVEHAGVSYQLLSANSNETRVLTAVLPGPVLVEYEDVVRAAGYEPGAVLPSSLAALAALDSEDPVLAAFLQAGSMTTVIAKGQDMLLYRTLELPEESQAQRDEAQRDIAVAVAYFEDRVETRPRALRYAGWRSAQEFGQIIQDTGLQVVELVQPLTTGAVSALGTASLAGVMGALAGVD